MKYLILLSLVSFQALSQNARPPLEELFKDVPLEQRQDKRIELALKMASSNNDTGYNKEMTPLLYALNLKENPKHGPSYYYLINKVLSQGQLSRFSFTPETTEKADKLLNQGLKNAPDYAPLHVRRAYVDIGMKKDKEMIRENVLKVYYKASQMSDDVLIAYGQVLSWLDEHEKSAEVNKLAGTKAATPEDKGLVDSYSGLSAAKAGNWEGCVEGYKKARAVKKSYGEDVELVGCLNQSKRYDEALAIAKENNSTPGGNDRMDCYTGQAYTGKGQSLYMAGDYQAAEPYLTEGVKGCKYENRYTALAFNYLKLNNLEKAKETILEWTTHSPEKQKYLLSWYTYFKNANNSEQKLFFYEEAVKHYTNPSERVNAYLFQMFELKNANDPAFVDFSRRSINSAASIYESNRSDFDTVKYFGMMNSIFGIKRDSLIYLAKAKEVLGQAKSMKSEADHNIEQNLKIIAEIEAGIQSGKIQPSEP
ncbi:MAG: hypothetical protein V4598_05795 [Bdellovibrionota bacterium]